MASVQASAPVQRRSVLILRWLDVGRRLRVHGRFQGREKEQVTSTPLVARLRNVLGYAGCDCCQDSAKLCGEAADAIERLMRERDEWQVRLTLEQDRLAEANTELQQAVELLIGAQTHLLDGDNSIWRGKLDHFVAAHRPAVEPTVVRKCVPGCIYEGTPHAVCMQIGYK